jgi:phage gp46-like protein
MAGDITVLNGDLKIEEGLSTAVLISIFSDARVHEDELDDPKENRGWWADQVSNEPIGSELWLLERASSTQENTLLGKSYIENALKWMLDDKIVDSIEVETWIFGNAWNRRLGFHVILKKGKEKTTMYFDDLWEASFLET